MKKMQALILTITLCLLGTWVLSYVTLPKTWTLREQLTYTDLNSSFTTLNTGLDDLQDEIGDTANVRLPTTFPLYWTHAFGDSTASNDSLTIEISVDSPLGDTQCLYVKNDEGVVETVTLYLDGFLYNPIATLDSIVFSLWTEAISADSDYVAISVWDDSTTTAWESHFKDVADDSLSATARTTVSTRIATPAITGGRFRLKAIIKSISDSLFVLLDFLLITSISVILNCGE